MTEAVEPAEGIQVPVQPYVDSLKRQLGEQTMKHAGEVAERDALIEYLKSQLSEAREAIDAIGKDQADAST